MPIKNRSKRAEYDHKYHIEHRAEITARARKWRLANPEKTKRYYKRWYLKNRDYVMKLKLKAVKLKGSKCLDCGFNDLNRPEVFDFDHTTNNKNGDVGDFIANSNWDNVIKELKLCDLVCANCHRTRTKKRALARRA